MADHEDRCEGESGGFASRLVGASIALVGLVVFARGSYLAVLSGGPSAGYLDAAFAPLACGFSACVLVSGALLLAYGLALWRSAGRHRRHA